MDEIHRQMLKARRQAARDQSARLSDRPTPAATPIEAAPSESPVGTLVLLKLQGEWRYFLCDQRLRGGETVELYVNAQVGWLACVFHWGRRHTSVPTVRIAVSAPDTGQDLGEIEIHLPQAALFRWPVR